MKTHRSAPTRRAISIMLTAGHLVAAGVLAGEPTRVHRRPVEAAQTWKSCAKPYIALTMAADDSFALNFAYRGAIKKLEKNELCRALFDNLELDGLQALGQSRYQPPQTEYEEALCGTGVAATTVVGWRRVLICGHFHKLSRPARVTVLIHEALHTAGLNEAPHDLDGLTSEEINRMVDRACSH